MSGAPVLTRTDSAVDFNWGSGSPGTGAPNDNFSVRWTGQVQPQFSEVYTFFTTSDDGIRLWVNNVLLINDWNNHGPTERSATILLTAGTRYEIKVEYYEATGGAVARLSWSSASQAKQVIPTTRLYPSGSTTPPPAATTFSLFGDSPPSRTVMDGTAVELGLRIQPKKAGTLTQIRYYKPVGETGAHTGRIWSSSGSLLASVVFTNETASGWQTAALSTPLPVTAETTYVVSVNSNTAYGITENALANAVSNDGLTSLAGNNGVYVYSVGSFPNASWNNSNYFRDVVLSTGTTQPPPPIDPPSTNGVSILGTQLPARTENDSPVELGMKFRSSEAGVITHIRYFRPSTETGSHQGNIWTLDGRRLAQVTFTGETASGWQTAQLNPALSIAANGTYIVSVNSNTAYAITSGGLASSISNTPLTTVAGSNGVFNYEPGAFPFETFENSNYFRDVVFVRATATTPAPVDPNPPASPAWTERILGSDGAINWTQYAEVANNFNRKDILDWRHGPKAADYGIGAPSASTPLVYQPSADGRLRQGVVVSGNRNWTVGAPGPDSDPFAAWLTSGQILFSPIPTAGNTYQGGTLSATNSDGGVKVRRDSNGNDIPPQIGHDGLVMRIQALWQPDYWLRNGIALPQAPTLTSLRSTETDLPLPPVAIARSVGGIGVSGYIAFRNGLIATVGTGNDAYTGIGNAQFPTVRLPANKVPTAMTVTLNNEFLLVATWDAVERKGQVAVISIGGRVNNGVRVYGLHHWPTTFDLKLIGFVDLPFAAPLSIDSTTQTRIGNPRGTSGPDGYNGQSFGDQAVRDRWFNARPYYEGAYDVTLPGGGTARYEDLFRQTAQYGYAIVASRAENKVALINLRPLFSYYRKMMFTTAANYNETRNVGPASNQWPYSFLHAPEQVPTVVKVWTLPQPTAVATGNVWNSWEAPRSYNDGRVRQPLTTAYVATMDGKLHLFDVSGLFDYTTTAPGALPDAPRKTVTVGRNPVQLFRGFFNASHDDLVVVSRVDREMRLVNYDGTLLSTLRDRRIQDPVSVMVSLNQMGYGGSGPSATRYLRVMSVMDFSGGKVLSYGLDDKRNHPEQWPMFDAEGKPIDFLFGIESILPGYPFAFVTDEVI